MIDTQRRQDIELEGTSATDNEVKSPTKEELKVEG